MTAFRPPAPPLTEAEAQVQPLAIDPPTSIGRLRQAAEAIRADAPTTLMAAVADWLLAEAAVLEAIPPLAYLAWGVQLEMDNGLSSVIEVGETSDGSDRMLATSTAHGLAVADAVLGSTS